MEQTIGSLNVPKEAADLLEEAYASQEDGDYKEALRRCEQALELAPAWAEAHNLRGMVLEGLGRQAAAVTAYRRAVELDPDDADLRENLLDAEEELKEAALPEEPTPSLPAYYTPLAPGEDLVTVATFSYPIEAYLAKTRLDWEEIPCFVADDRLVTWNWLYSRAIGGVRLQVRSGDWEAALDVLEAPPLDEAELEAQAGPDDPRCPDCDSSQVHFVGVDVSEVFASWVLTGPFLWSLVLILERLLYPYGSYSLAELLSIILFLVGAIPSGFPLPIFKNRWECNACGSHWKESELVDVEEELVHV